MSGSVDSVPGRTAQFPGSGSSSRYRQSLNLNKAFKSSTPTHKGGSAARNGLQVLGSTRPRLQSSLVAAPKPVDLPSLRKENAGLDPTVSLVPSGGSGWAVRNKESDETVGAVEHDNAASGSSEETGSAQGPIRKSPRNWAITAASSSPLPSSPDFPTAAEALKNQKLEKKDGTGELKTGKEARATSAGGDKMGDNAEKAFDITKQAEAQRPESVPPIKSAWQIPAPPSQSNTDGPPHEKDHTWVDDDDDMDFSKVPVFQAGVDGVEVVEEVDVHHQDDVGLGLKGADRREPVSKIVERPIERRHPDDHLGSRGDRHRSHDVDRGWRGPPQPGPSRDRYPVFHDRRRGSVSANDVNHTEWGNWRSERHQSVVERDERNRFLNAHPPQLLQRATRPGDRSDRDRLDDKHENIPTGRPEASKPEEPRDMTVNTVDHLTEIPQPESKRQTHQEDGEHPRRTPPGWRPKVAEPRRDDRQDHNIREHEREGVPNGRPEADRSQETSEKIETIKDHSTEVPPPELKRHSPPEDVKHLRRAAPGWRPKAPESQQELRPSIPRRDERHDRGVFRDKRERDLDKISWRKDPDKPGDRVVAILQPERKPLGSSPKEEAMVHTKSAEVHGDKHDHAPDIISKGIAPREVLTKRASDGPQSRRESQDRVATELSNGKAARPLSRTSQARSDARNLDAFDSVMTSIKQMIDTSGHLIEQADSDTTLADVGMIDSPPKGNGAAEPRRPDSKDTAKNVHIKSEQYSNDREGSRSKNWKSQLQHTLAERTFRDEGKSGKSQGSHSAEGGFEKKGKRLTKRNSKVGRRASVETTAATVEKPLTVIVRKPASSDDIAAKPSATSVVDKVAPSKPDESGESSGSPTFSVAIPPEIDLSRKVNFFAMPDILSPEPPPPSANVLSAENDMTASDNVTNGLKSPLAPKEDVLLDAFKNESPNPQHGERRLNVLENKHAIPRHPVEAWATMLQPTTTVDLTQPWAAAVPATFSPRTTSYRSTDSGLLSQPSLMLHPTAQPLIVPQYPTAHPQIWHNKDSFHGATVSSQIGPSMQLLVPRQMMTQQFPYPWMVVPGGMQALKPQQTASSYPQVAVRPAGPPVQMTPQQFQALWKDQGVLAGMQMHPHTGSTVKASQQQALPTKHVGRFPERHRSYQGDVPRSNAGGGKPVGYGRLQPSSSQNLPTNSAPIHLPLGSALAATVTPVPAVDSNPAQIPSGGAESKHPSPVLPAQNSEVGRAQRVPQPPPAVPAPSSNPTQQPYISPPAATQAGKAGQVPLKSVKHGTPHEELKTAPSSGSDMLTKQVSGSAAATPATALPLHNIQPREASHKRTPSYGLQRGPYWQARQVGRPDLTRHMGSMAQGYQPTAGKDIQVGQKPRKDNGTDTAEDNKNPQDSAEHSGDSHMEVSKSESKVEVEKAALILNDTRVQQSRRPAQTSSETQARPSGPPSTRDRSTQPTSKATEETRGAGAAGKGAEQAITSSTHPKSTQRSLKRPASSQPLVPREKHPRPAVSSGPQKGDRQSVYKEDITPSGLKITYTSRTVAGPPTVEKSNEKGKKDSAVGTERERKNQAAVEVRECAEKENESKGEKEEGDMKGDKEKKKRRRQGKKAREHDKTDDNDEENMRDKSTTPSSGPTSSPSPVPSPDVGPGRIMAKKPVSPRMPPTQVEGDGSEKAQFAGSQNVPSNSVPSSRPSRKDGSRGGFSGSFSSSFSASRGKGINNASWRRGGATSAARFSQRRGGRGAEGAVSGMCGPRAVYVTSKQ
ncbi:hypothetical protein, variant [Spizellomyces punctatus DAOM BR117]|uniref:BAT2 N-terminal domain-containing protein n=1 Tax=Spizellomyces punctatus (strain DAOM BR117) TaxID=645134 RepID=A0A0L0HD62_SPIPD|nr:hypothetical protein, variant [Spizellomyces punctatus DAOM BR117]KNC98956.1 hypothetical protein, variant [Spizellomyces punctatus DAOM BR117]|eukprot:XP_016606996.1 hypothetical protein, variant [Spizellomyces punctatus DAOM BR117]